MRAPINPNAAPHGHETPGHLGDKRAYGRLFEKFDFDYVLFEHGHSDVVGVRCCSSGPEVIAGEVQVSPRHVLRNVERNFRQGAVGTIVICQDFSVMAAVARAMARALGPKLRPQVGLTNLMTLQLLQPRDRKGVE